jgi:hypothetical protein
MSTATEAKSLTISEVWTAVRAARRKHGPARVVPVMVCMSPEDLADIRYENRRGDYVTFDMVRGCWTVCGLPISEGQFPGADSQRVVVLQREALQVGRMPKDWRTLTVQDLNRTITEAF